MKDSVPDTVPSRIAKGTKNTAEGFLSASPLMFVFFLSVTAIVSHVLVMTKLGGFSKENKNKTH